MPDFIAPEGFDSEVHAADLLTVDAQLFDLNEHRYQAQAIKFIKENRLLFKAHDSLLLYSLEDDGVWSEISHDGGKQWGQRTWKALSPIKAEKIWELKHEFSRSEGRLFLDV